MVGSLLAVGFWPFYLPWQLSAAIIVTVYTPTAAVAAGASDVIHVTVADLLMQHPDTLIKINRYATNTLTNFTHYVTCSTRREETLDLLYANVKEAHSTPALPHLGNQTTA